MSRKKFICGNWKMFTSAKSGRVLAAEVAAGVTSDTVQVAATQPGQKQEFALKPAGKTIAAWRYRKQ